MKLIGHKKFYDDKETGFSFYSRMTPFYDISIVVYNKKDQVIRQFMVDFGALKAMHDFVDGRAIKPVDRLLMLKDNVPTLVHRYVEKEGMTIIRSVNSKFVNSAVVAKISNYGKEKDMNAIFLKRIAWQTDTKSVLGIDTLAIPLEGVKRFVKVVKKMFKSVDLDYELANPVEENKDAVN